MKQSVEHLRDRLSSKLRRTETGCMEFDGARTAFGHGRMTAGRGVNLKAHRAAYMVWVGEIPDGMCVLHRCDNPACCNPEHLFLGTRSDNIRDMDDKGRRVPRGPAVNQRRDDSKMARGSRNGNAILNEDMVRAIRQFGGSYAETALHFGVPRGTCADVMSRRTWRHVE